jgi:hypothetical protein
MADDKDNAGDKVISLREAGEALMRAKHPRAPSLRMMLEMLVEHRQSRAAESAAEDDLVAIDAAKLLTPPKPRWAAHIEHAKKDAVAAALHAVIREEGWHAYAAGGLDGMHALCNAATANSDLGAILDHRWDGIGVEAHGFWET